MNSLPIELLDKILHSIDYAHNERSGVISLLSVCRQWRECAISVLYRDLVIVDVNQLECFLESHDRQAVNSITESVTILMSKPDRGLIHSAQQLATQLPRLATEAIAHMAKLKSFSMTLSQLFKQLNLRAAISSILQSLPERCVNLELDIGTEVVRDADADRMVCEDLRRVLPRMHDVRIRMMPLFDTILGTWDLENNFHPIGLPHIRSLLIDCVALSWTTGGERKMLWNSLVRALRRMEKLKETNAAELVVVGSHYRDLNTAYPCWTSSRCHVRGGHRTTTWSLPCVAIGQPLRNADLIRTDVGSFVTSSGQTISRDLAGGRPWRTLCTGSRLSVSSSPFATWTSDEELGLFTEAEWHEKYPEMQLDNKLLSDEKEAGMLLLNAKERKGIKVRSARPITPPDTELHD